MGDLPQIDKTTVWVASGPYNRNTIHQLVHGGQLLQPLISSCATLQQMAGGVDILRWLANSPDLSCIENAWFWMKDWMEIHCPYPLESSI